jgi:hypothetical protein
LAIQNGFKVSSRDALTADYIRFYCHRGQHGKGAHQSTKTNYTFQIDLQWEVPVIGQYHVMPPSILDHNHELLPPEAPPFSEAISSTARAMPDVGIERRGVLVTVYHIIGHAPTPEQIALIIGAEQIRALVLGTDDIIAHVPQNGGDLFAFELSTGECTAVLTSMQLEKANLKRFGYVLFLDGTMIRNTLSWTPVLITMVNECYQIVSGDLFFTVLETEDAFDWLLDTLWDVTSHAFRTVVTDENYALVCSMSKFHFSHPEVGHRLCVFHTRRHFQKKVDAITKDSKVETEAIVPTNHVFSKSCVRG